MSKPIDRVRSLDHLEKRRNQSGDIMPAHRFLCSSRDLKIPETAQTFGEDSKMEAVVVNPRMGVPAIVHHPSSYNTHYREFTTGVFYRPNNGPPLPTLTAPRLVLCVSGT